MTESGGFGPSIPTKQRMPNQQGGSDAGQQVLQADPGGGAIADDARTPIDISGPPHETRRSPAPTGSATKTG